MTAENDFIGSSKIWRLLSCLKLGDYHKYFNVSTEEVKQRLKYAMMGHFTGMERPKAGGIDSSYGQSTAIISNGSAEI